MTLSDHELARRRRVVHGWEMMLHLSNEEKAHIKRYLAGEVDRPPMRWVRIDEACG